jgi:hypothetical protein
MIQNGSRKEKNFLRIKQNQCHFVGFVVLILAIYLFSENGHRMQKLSHSELFPKQEKVKGQIQLVKGRTTDMENDVSIKSQ